MRPPQPRNCRLNDVIRDLEELLHSHESIRARERLRVLSEDFDVVVHVDEELMRQVLLNLALNAFDAMGDTGELLVSVAVRPNHLPPEVVVRFIDEGDGIDEETAARIFEPFFTTKPNGTGLGLPMAHRIVTNHDGQLRARSVDGGGAEFSVHLPLVGLFRDGHLITGDEALEVLAADASHASVDSAEGTA
jgi:signal transduction histidine kinase